MSQRPAIVVVGSSNMDVTVRTARLPRPGETLAGHSCQLGCGGKGANQAVTAARLGARAAMIGRVGRDLFGEQILANYRGQGIDVAHVRIDDDRPTGMASIVVDDQARNCILVVPGANLGLSPDDVRAAGDWIRSAALLLCQLEVPLETTQEALRIAREAGVRTVLNPAPAVPLPEELLQLADLCVPNETELELLTGQRVSSLEAAAAAAWTLLERGPQQVIVTLGERGVLLADARSVEHIPALPVEAVDPTGAGDAFIGGLAVFLAEGLALPDAVRCANAVAALSVSRPGTQTALPTRAEADAFLRRAGR